MAEIYFDVDAALSEVPVNIFPLTDDTDFKTRETGITYNQAGMDLVWNFVTTAGVYTQTAVTPTTGGAYDWAHQGDGMYSIEIPASGGASINNDTEGFGWFTGICTGVLPWRSPIFGFRAAALNNALIDGGDLLDVNVTHIADTSQTGRDIGASVLLSSGTGSGQVSLSSGTVTVGTNNDKTGYTASTVSDKTGYSLTVTPPTASAIADAVLDEALSGHSTPGTAGISLTDILGYVTALRSALTDLRAANLDKIVGTIVAGTHNPQSGDAYGRIGINGAGLSALGDTRISFLDASILSRSSHSAADVWAVTTRTLSGFGSLVSDIATAIWGAVARTITGGTVSTVSDKTGYSISGTKQTLDALNDFNPASDTVARVTLADTCTTNTDMRGTDSALLASNYTVPPSVSSIADAVWDEATSGHSGAGTAGLALTSASAPTAEQVADAVWDESVSGHTTGGSTGAAIIAAGSAGDPWSTLIPGAYGAGTAGKIVGDNINATISSRSSHSAADVWAVSVRTLSSFGTLVADMAAAVWSTTTRTLSAFGFTVAPTVADIRTEIDSNSTQLIAIKAKTDQLTFTVAGHVDATASITGGGDATEAHQLDMIDKLKGLMSKAHVLTTAVGTFAPATDSNEAIRDRGDVAWNNGSINTMASTRAVISTDSSDAIIQDCAYKDISFKSGDDFEFDLDFPMDITAYTITAVVDGVSFTVTKKTTVRVGFSLTATQTATLRDNFPWSLTLVNAGKTRKYITGKYIKI